ncbi:hypothetical protein LXL04_035551 [Taraxacum kok-saghyz]
MVLTVFFTFLCIYTYFVRGEQSSVWVGFGVKPQPKPSWSVSWFQNPRLSVFGWVGFSVSQGRFLGLLGLNPSVKNSSVQVLNGDLFELFITADLRWCDCCGAAVEREGVGAAVEREGVGAAVRCVADLQRRGLGIADSLLRFEPQWRRGMEAVYDFQIMN